MQMAGPSSQERLERRRLMRRVSSVPLRMTTHFQDIKVAGHHLGELHLEGSMPLLYEDKFTVIQPVNQNVHTLRGGDHCVISLMASIADAINTGAPWINAVVQKFFGWIFFHSRFGFYHHFLVLDDVASFSNDGSNTPLRKDGLPVRIAEYSNTTWPVLQRLWRKGPFHILAQHGGGGFAPFHERSLAQYLGGIGHADYLFRVMTYRTDEERQQIVSDCRELLSKFDPDTQEMKTSDPDERKRLAYDILHHNCEHAAFQLAGKKHVSRSPQVDLLLWNLARATIQVIGVLVLIMGSSDLTDEVGGDSGYHVIPRGMDARMAYLVLAVLPAGMQFTIQLTKVCVNLTRRHTQMKELQATRGMSNACSGETIDEDAIYWHLLTKECGRAIVAGGFSTGFILIVPWLCRPVHENCFRFVYLVLFAQLKFDICYGLLAHIVEWLFLRTLGGVPVFRTKLK